MKNYFEDNDVRSGYQRRNLATIVPAFLSSSFPRFSFYISSFRRQFQCSIRSAYYQSDFISVHEEKCPSPLFHLDRAKKNWHTPIIPLFSFSTILIDGISISNEVLNRMMNKNRKFVFRCYSFVLVFRSNVMLRNDSFWHNCDQRFFFI